MQQKKKTNFIKYAKHLKAQGISVVPLSRDGSKLPMIKWTSYQTQLMPDFEIEEHFAECGGVAAITGSSSNLYVLDFDLKYQLPDQDFWGDFMAQVPTELKRKMLINKTRNGGYHVWMRTKFEDKSRKLTRRLLTIPELTDRYNEMLAKNVPPEKASRNLLKNPFEVIIETRSRNSYAVFYHMDYQRFYGKELHEFSIEEVEMLNEIAYSLDYPFVPQQKFVGEAKVYKDITQYNQDTTAQQVLDMVVSTGMFSYVETEHSGNILVRRIGSSTRYSGRIYGETGILHLFTDNSMFDTSIKSTFSPFEVYMLSNDLEYKQAVNQLKQG